MRDIAAELPAALQIFWEKCCGSLNQGI